MNYLILLSAGKGRRLNIGYPKALIKISDKPLFIFVLERLINLEFIHKVIITTPPKHKEKFKSELTKYNFDKEIILIPGGKERVDSVRNAVNSISEARYVFIHDVARLFPSRELFEKLYRAVRRYQAVIPVFPITSAIKKVVANYIRNTLDRDDLYQSQTPQAFKFSYLKESLSNFNQGKIYDDAQLLELSNYKVKVIKGEPWNFKITFPWDLKLAEAVLKLKLL